MRLIILGIFFLSSLNSKAQFSLDFFINKNSDAVIIFYAEHISEPAKQNTLPRPTSISNDAIPITIEISPCKATHELFFCKSDTVNFQLEFYFDKTNKCNKITIESTSADCLNAYFEKYLTNSSELKWKNDSDGKKISSVPFREEEKNGETTFYYLEVTIEDRKIMLEEKNIQKSEWKKFGKTLVKLK